VVERSVFDDVADAVRGLVPAPFGELRSSSHRYGVKVWFGSDKPTKEHYEAQVVGREHAAGATVLALEVGFHSEHPKEADNELVIEGLLRSERKWRRQLGKEAVAGAFLGRAEHWRRVSEVWPDPNLADPELVLEVATRLTDYVTTLEPHRAARRGAAAGAGRRVRSASAAAGG
jgi:hypothetical protein